MDGMLFSVVVHYYTTSFHYVLFRSIFMTLKPVIPVIPSEPAKPLPQPAETRTLGAGKGFRGYGYGSAWETPGLPVTITSCKSQLYITVVNHCFESQL